MKTKKKEKNGNKGVKNIEFKIWSRTLKFKNDHLKLERVQKLLQKIRTLDQ